jgi:hypothetical protein
VGLAFDGPHDFRKHVSSRNCPIVQRTIFNIWNNVPYGLMFRQVVIQAEQENWNAAGGVHVAKEK